MHLFLLMLIMLIVGCSPLEIRKVIFGPSLHDFDTTEKKYTKTFQMKPEDCFKRVCDVLQARKAVITRSDLKNKFIVACGFNDILKSKLDQTVINTTEVGIIFKEIAEGKTEMTVISDDPRLAEIVADELSSKLNAKQSSSL